MPYTEVTRRVSRGAVLLLAAVLAQAATAADLASQAAALTADVPHGRVLYLKHCASCHGREAWGDGPREIPALAGQRESFLIAQLARFISGARPGSQLHGPVMQQTLQPQDVKRAQALRDLGGWLSQAVPDREPERGPGQALAAARRAYAYACAGCHGATGEGSERSAVPALAGQHYSYLLAQLHRFSLGRPGHAPGLEAGIAGTPAQQEALADYLSRLTLARPSGRP